MTSGASDLKEFYERESQAGRLRVEPFHGEKLTPEGGKRSKQAVHLLGLDYQVEMFVRVQDDYFLQRPAPGVAELWVEEDLLGNGRTKGGVMARIKSSGSDDRLTGSRLLYALWTNRLPYATPSELRGEGLLTADDWETIEAALLEEHANVAWQDVDDPYGLPRLADELDLAPRCKGTRSPTCYCNCPSGRSHRADLNHVQGLWYCGFCKIGGGLDELRAAAESRRGVPARTHSQERRGVARGPVAPRATEAETVHLLVTWHEVVGAGSVMAEEDVLRVFADKGDAEEYLIRAFNRMAESAEDKVQMIESSPHLVFESPIIIGVLWLKVSSGEVSVSAALAQITRRLRGSDDREALLRSMVSGYRGACYSPGPSAWELNDALDSFQSHYVAGEDEDLCPYCNAVNLPGSCDECEHYVGICEGRDLYGTAGDRLTEVWSTIRGRVEELLELGCSGDSIVASIPVRIQAIASAANDLVDTSIIEVMTVCAECEGGATVEIFGATSSSRTCLYCPDPKNVDLTLKSLTQLELRLEKLQP